MIIIALYYCFANNFQDELNHWKVMVNENENCSLEEILQYLKTHRDWPDENKVILKGERLISQNTPSHLAKIWFDKYKPRTVNGLMLSLCLSQKSGQDIKEKVVKGWIDFDFTVEQQKNYLSIYGKYLTANDHIKRAKKLLYQEKVKQVENMFFLFKPDVLKNIKLRIKFIRQERVREVCSLVKTKIPGLFFEIVRHYRRQNKPDLYANALCNNSNDEHQFANYWWRERNFLAKHFLENKDYRKALETIKKHKLKSGSDYLEAVWLKGWIAHEFLHEKKYAHSNFIQMHHAAEAPISRAKAAYWAGKSAPSNDIAMGWYAKAAKHQLTFYGLLAREKIKNPSPIVFKKICPDYHSQDKLINLALNIDPRENKCLIEKFITKAFSRITDSNLGLKFLVNISLKYEPYIAVRGAKVFTRHFRTTPNLSFAYPELMIKPPYIEIMQHKKSYLEVLAHSIIRQETEFNKDAISPANAYGYMQLRPGTAKEKAKILGLQIKNEKDLLNEVNNVTLGTSYVIDLLQYYDNCLVLAIVAYNAGMGRVNKWLKTYGDPRKGEIPMLQWIELIPYYETRNYVMRVLENICIYLHKKNQGIPITMLLNMGCKNVRGISQQPKHLKNLV